MAATLKKAAKEYLKPPVLSNALLVAASAVGAQVYPDSR